MSENGPLFIDKDARIGVRPVLGIKHGESRRERS